MTLEFPNRSRSFDENRKAVRFVGHDGMFEVPFFIEIGALTKPGDTVLSENDCLAAFDTARGYIQNVARLAYSSRRGPSYTLTSSDFS